MISVTDRLYPAGSIVDGAAGALSMPSAYRQSRRKFLQAALAAAAASGCGIACDANGTPWRFLTVEEARTLAALCDQIIRRTKIRARLGLGS